MPRLQCSRHETPAELADLSALSRSRPPARRLRAQSRVMPLRVFYGDAAQAQEALDDTRLLALVQYAEATVAATDTDPRRCQVTLRPLDGGYDAEIWLSAQPVQRGASAGVSHASDGQVAWLQLVLAETAPEAAALQALTAMAYQRLIAAANALGYPYFLRTWNYFPAINQECGGMERYRAFCAGRYQILAATQSGFETHLPAATAIGAAGGGLRIYALTARSPGIQIENPRQVSAFRYPPQYGPRSPSFSRAVLKDWGEIQHLYISGTASIAGHASRHETLLGQLDETLINLQALLTEAQRRAGAALGLRLLKVYVRTAPEDLAPLRARLGQTFGDVPVQLLQGAICRQELLIEIEGLATSGPLPHSQESAAS